jgi:hypothetical protein
MKTAMCHLVILDRQFFDGPPPEKLAPSGGSAVHLGTSVGVICSNS